MNPMLDYFATADVLAERIKAVEVPGLLCITAEEAAQQRSAPVGLTAVVAFAGEAVREQLGRCAYSASQTWVVHLSSRTATTRDSTRDGAAVGAIIKALHGYAPYKGEKGRVQYQGATSAPVDGAREYQLTFSLVSLAEWD